MTLTPRRRPGPVHRPAAPVARSPDPAAAMDSAVMHPLTYIVANDYSAAMDYKHAHDLTGAEVRFVSCPEVLKGAGMHPRVIVVGAADQIHEGIADILIDRQAEVTYEQ